MSISDRVNDLHRLDQLPPEDPLEYHRDTYGVPAYVGVRVAMEGKPGVITGSSGPHILVLFDGDKTPVPCHPTWEMTYHEDWSTRATEKAHDEITALGWEEIP